MKRYIYIAILFITATLLTTGCSRHKAEPKIDANVTKEVNETVAEIDPFDWTQNDEIIKCVPATKIVVVKSKRILVLLDEKENILSKHRVSLGKNPEGAKVEKGDYRTPEGTYKIIDKREDKKYYKELLIDYPNEHDIEEAKKLGVNPGGGITLHAQVPRFWDGNGDDYTLSHDWTEGCVAMTNKGMDNVWQLVKLGTVVEIRE